MKTMNPAEQALWSKIQAFQIDDPTARFPFSQRLARENRWPHSRALRAIEEYKRFVFLGCMAGHPVSPSEDVDQVWHLHLAYTKSYWKDFCGDVLGRPFHHHPTKGGADESAKFEDWHARTRASYQRLFAESPPPDFWPPHAAHHDLKWVDTGSNWVIPKPRWASMARAALLLLLLLAVGCGQLAFNSVFELRGPDFLSFYLWFSITVLVGAALWRRHLIRSARFPTANPENLDPFEVAYLAGKGDLATSAAIISLVERKIVELPERTRAVISRLRGADEAVELHPLERALVPPGPREVPVAKARLKARPTLKKIHRRLAGRGLVYSPGQVISIVWYPLSTALMVAIVGAVKIGFGVSRDKPVAFLAIGTIAILVCSLIYFSRRPFRTAAADQVLDDLRKATEPYKAPVDPVATGSPLSLPLAIGLYGLPILEQTPYARHKNALAPPVANGSSAGCSAGCSGGSGGGGGGGDGGGGGCGGCGGD